MNTYRYDEEKRRQWVRDKLTRAKSVKQICREASISRATLYNWLDEFKHLEQELNFGYDEAAEALGVQKASKPELLRKTSPETGERYRMLVSALAGLDSNRHFSRKLVAVLIKRFTLTVAQACSVVGIDEEAYGYKPRKPEVEDYLVYEALVGLIREDRSRDFETCYELLLKQNPDWTRKQIKRVYRDGMVYLERKRANTRWEKQDTEGKAVPHVSLAGSKRVQRPGGTWNLGLLEYSSVLDGSVKSWWMLCILDGESGLALNAATGLGSVTTEDILGFLDKAAAENGTPKKLKIPGKPALAARELTRWVWEHRMALITLSLNKPENAEATEQMERSILATLQPAQFTSVSGLAEAVESWIAKEAYA